MPSISEPERNFMQLVNAVRKGAPAPSPEIEKIVNQYDIKTDKDIKTMQEEEDLLFGASAEELEELREYIRTMVREITGTGNVAGYLTPNAFGKPGDEEKNAERAADLTGYSVVPESLHEYEKNESVNEEFKHLISVDTPTQVVSKPVVAQIEKLAKSGVRSKDIGLKMGFVGNQKAATDAFEKLKNKIYFTLDKRNESLNENRWLKLKKEDTPPHAKIGRGISEINKQLSEMERFLNWYGRIKNENGVSNSAYWTRTNKTLFRIKERLIKIESSIRKIAG